MEDAKRRKEAEESQLPPEERAKLQRKKDAEVAKDQGNELYKKKQLDQALEAYNKAVELNPDESTYHTNIAAVKMAQNKFDDAIAACDCAIELMKGSGYDYVKMGKAMARKAACFVSKGELDTGIEIYRSALLESNDYAIKDALKKAEQKKKSTD